AWWTPYSSVLSVRRLGAGGTAGGPSAGRWKARRSFIGSTPKRVGRRALSGHAGDAVRPGSSPPGEAVAAGLADPFAGACRTSPCRASASATRPFDIEVSL